MKTINGLGKNLFLNLLVLVLRQLYHLPKGRNLDTKCEKHQQLLTHVVVFVYLSNSHSCGAVCSFEPV